MALSVARAITAGKVRSQDGPRSDRQRRFASGADNQGHPTSPIDSLLLPEPHSNPTTKMQSGQPQGASRPNKRPRGGSRGGRGGGGGGGGGGQPRKPNAAQAAMEGVTDTGPSTPIDSPVTLTRAPSPVQNGAESSRGFTTTRFTDFLGQGAISKTTADGIGALRPVHEFCTPVSTTTSQYSLDSRLHSIVLSSGASCYAASHLDRSRW